MNSNLPATKADLEKLATKEELKAAVAKLATKEKLKKLENKMDTMDTGLRILFKFEIDKAFLAMDDKNKKYHDELMTKFDGFLKEIIDGREARTIISHRLSDHEERIAVLEQTTGLAAA